MDRGSGGARNVERRARDLKSQERNFGKLGYEGERGLIASACTCDAAGNCKRKLSDADFAKELHRRELEMADALTRSAPELANKIADMPDAEHTRYGNKLESDYISSVLKPAEVQRWNRMVRSCILTNGALPPAPPPDTKNDRPHDGSLSRHGTHDSMGDFDDGKLDEPGGIAWLVDACVAGANEKVHDHPLARPRCGCLVDYLRRSPPSILRMFSGDGKDVPSLPGVQKCSAWDGSGKPPYLVAGMRPWVDVAGR